MRQGKWFWQREGSDVEENIWQKDNKIKRNCVKTSNEKIKICDVGIEAQEGRKELWTGRTKKSQKYEIRTWYKTQLEILKEGKWFC